MGHGLRKQVRRAEHLEDFGELLVFGPDFLMEAEGKIT